MSDMTDDEFRNFVRRNPDYQGEPILSAREPRTEAGKALLALWNAGRTHPPSAQRLRDFMGLVLDIEREAATLPGLVESARELVDAIAEAKPPHVQLAAAERLTAALALRSALNEEPE